MTGFINMGGVPGGGAGGGGGQDHDDPALGAAPAGAYPTDLTAVANLTGWWRADRKQAKYSDLSEPTGWGDEAGVAVENNSSFYPIHDATGVIVPPEYKADGGLALNNQPVFEIGTTTATASRELWHTDTATTQNLPVHMFFVLNVLTHTNNMSVVSSAAATNRNHVRWNTSTTAQMINTAASGYTNTVTVPATGTAYVLEAFFDGLTTSFMRVNNGTKATGGAAGQAAWNGLMLGANGVSGAAAPAHYDLAELVRFDAEITGTDLTNLYAYLDTRYGL